MTVPKIKKVERLWRLSAKFTTMSLRRRHPRSTWALRLRRTSFMTGSTCEQERQSQRLASACTSGTAARSLQNTKTTNFQRCHSTASALSTIAASFKQYPTTHHTPSKQSSVDTTSTTYTTNLRRRPTAGKCEKLVNWFTLRVVAIQHPATSHVHT